VRLYAPSDEKDTTLPIHAAQIFAIILRLPGVKREQLPVAKVEAYNKKGLVRVIDYRDFELATGLWTARNYRMAELTRNSRHA